MIEAFNQDEILEIANSLEDYHKIFYVFFEMSSVSYVDDEDGLRTAAVEFHEMSKPSLKLNREFWKSLNHREKLFVICHECLHVILLHDERTGMEVPGATWEIVNVAQDICINEMIVYLFGFDREDIRDWQRFCWIDTCFKEPDKILRNQNFYYYLKLLIEEAKDSYPELLDFHGDPSKGGRGVSVDVAEKLAGELTPEELETLIDSFPGAGHGAAAGMLEAIVGEKRKRSKIQFTKLIRHLKRTRIKEVESEHESFVAEDRRFSDVIRRSKVTLPGKHPYIKPSKDRLLTAMFMDVSGSCVHYLPKFNQIYAAFEHERAIFDIRSFIFDVRVTEFKPGDKTRIGGGTKFQIIEDKIQELKLEYGKYPDCVVVVTDGDSGDVPNIEIPSRWVWLLTPRPVYRMIPKTSKTHLIDDVAI